MMAEDPLATMVNKVSLDPRARVTREDVVTWAGSLSNWDFYNSVSLRIAQEYQAGILSYEVCDHIMNDLWSSVTEGLERHSVLPSPFFEVYEAFDAGEYYRKPDRSDDPVSAYTDPMIRDLLLQYSATAVDSAHK